MARFRPLYKLYGFRGLGRRKNVYRGHDSHISPRQKAIWRRNKLGSVVVLVVAGYAAWAFGGLKRITEGAFEGIKISTVFDGIDSFKNTVFSSNNIDTNLDSAAVAPQVQPLLRDIVILRQVKEESKAVLPSDFWQRDSLYLEDSAQIDQFLDRIDLLPLSQLGRRYMKGPLQSNNALPHSPDNSSSKRYDVLNAYVEYFTLLKTVQSFNAGLTPTDPGWQQLKKNYDELSKETDNAIKRIEAEIVFLDPNALFYPLPEVELPVRVDRDNASELSSDDAQPTPSIPLMPSTPLVDTSEALPFSTIIRLTAKLYDSTKPDLLRDSIVQVIDRMSEPQKELLDTYWGTWLSSEATAPFDEGAESIFFPNESYTVEALRGSMQSLAAEDLKNLSNSLYVMLWLTEPVTDAYNAQPALHQDGIDWRAIESHLLAYSRKDQAIVAQMQSETWQAYKVNTSIRKVLDKATRTTDLNEALEQLKPTMITTIDSTVVLDTLYHQFYVDAFDADGMDLPKHLNEPLAQDSPLAVMLGILDGGPYEDRLKDLKALLEFNENLTKRYDLYISNYNRRSIKVVPLELVQKITLSQATGFNGFRAMPNKALLVLRNQDAVSSEKLAVANSNDLPVSSLEHVI